MSQALSALARAFRDAFNPRMLAVLLVPAFGALLIWIALGWFFWEEWTAWLNGLATQTAAGRWLEEVGAGWLLRSVAALGLIALIIPATLITAMIITEIIAMPMILGFVGARYYPALRKKAGGTVAGSLANTATAIALFSLLWLATLPLWLTGVAAFVLPALLSAYLNQRIFRYDALSEHASREEYEHVAAQAKGTLFWLGLVLALLYYVPLLNLLVPVLSGLAYTHLCLGELERLRARA